ncbi:MAG: Fpg/Nei family DNA glycosylase [Cellulomonadaceae bacterium]|nr:Fpg/Nei family DNA glycosylase [Cellulomonadaceae bacterium]
MPEGDILARTAATLNRALTGDVLVRAELRWPDAGGVDLVGRTVVGTASYGKHLLTRFDDGRTLHTHLRMEGSWRIAETGTSGASGRGPFDRAVVGTQRWTAIGHRLGMLDVVPTIDEHALIGHLGPDLLAPTFPTLGLALALERFAEQGTTPVAEVLLDQRVQAGIGTIYLAESLFARRLWPWTPAIDVTDPASLLMTARVLMERSVASDSPGVRRAHGRAGKPCVRCRTPIAVGAARRPPYERPVFWCPTCQAKP